MPLITFQDILMEKNTRVLNIRQELKILKKEQNLKKSVKVITFFLSGFATLVCLFIFTPT